MARQRYLRLLLAVAALVAVAAVPVAVATPASAVSGLVIVNATSPDTASEDFKWAQAYCPVGTHVLGGGAAINGADDAVHLSSMLPMPPDIGVPDSYWATAMEDARGYDGSWSLSVWAVCGSGVSGWQIVQANTAGASGSLLTTAVATCPAGTQVIGVGGASTGGSPFILDSVDPSDGLDRVSVEVTHDGSYQSGEAWGAYAFAVCVDPVPGQTLVSAFSGMSTGDKTTGVNCPAGTRVHGVGGGLTGALGQAHIARLAPDDGNGNSGADIDARQDLTGANRSWLTYVYAICAS